MKIILIGMCVLLGLTLAVIVVGMALPKAHIASRSAVFRSTPEILFAIIDGPQTWRSNVKKNEAVASQNGRRRWRETDAHGHTIAYEAIERQPPSLLKTQIITANLPYSGRWTFKLNPINGSTLLRITEEGEVYNPVFRFMSRFVIGRTRTMDTYLRDLGATTGQQVEIRN